MYVRIVPPLEVILLSTSSFYSCKDSGKRRDCSGILGQRANQQRVPYCAYRPAAP